MKSFLKKTMGLGVIVLGVVFFLSASFNYGAKMSIQRGTPGTFTMGEAWASNPWLFLIPVVAGVIAYFIMDESA